MSLDCSNASLLLGGTIMAGLVSLALSNKGGASQTAPSTGVSISVPNTLSTSKAFLLQICAENPGRLPLLMKMLTAPVVGTQAQIDVLNEFKRFAIQKAFFIDKYNSFTLANEQLVFANSTDNSALLALIAKIAYELKYKNFL